MDQQPEKKPRQRVSWRRIGIALLVIFVALWVVYPATMHVMVWYFAEKEARDSRCAIMPQPLVIKEIANLDSGVDASAFGYSFRVPWQIVKQHGAKSFSTLEFANGASVMIVDDANDSAGPGLLVNMTPFQAAVYKDMFGEQAVSSKYEFLRAEFNTSPSDVSFWHSRAHNAATITNLMSKDGMLRKSSALYWIDIGEMRGFQVGDSAQDSSAIWLWLFDASDRETWIIFHAGKQARWTQPQINAMIASIHISPPQ